MSQWAAVVILSYAALLVSLGSPYIFGHKIEAGQIAEQDYYARQKQFIVDLVKTQQAQDEARHTTLPVFERDLKAIQNSMANLRANLDELQRIQQQGLTTNNATLAALATQVPANQYSTWRHEIERAALQFQKSTPLLQEDDRSRWQSNVYEYLPDNWPAGLRNSSAALIASNLHVNMTIDAEATQEKIKEQVAHIKPVVKQIDSGALIIGKGERLSMDEVSLLNQVGITHTRDFNHVLAVATSLFTAFCLFGFFLYTYAPQYFFSPSAIALMATVCVVASSIAASFGHDHAQFVPLPATALVLSVVFGRRVAIVLALLLIVFLRVSELIDPAHLLALAAACGIAIGINITKRKELMLTGIMIGVVQALSYFVAVTALRMQGSDIGTPQEVVQNILAGLSSSVAAIGILPFLESIFGILTPFRVAELSEPDQPLLRQLEENAPGTYQHSLAVANLAESGAKSINADINLVRAGAMYHDIGKMVTPKFFIENQLGDKNPHDEIQPEESRARVLAHVTNGLVLAKKYGLPKPIQAFIPEHQGTTIMAYFYHKACVRDGIENVKELDYRYPGPKPQTKETAIVMLADVSEAVTHSLNNPTQDEVDAAIANVFKARWNDGQFDESGLTEEELGRVQQAFVRVWRTLHHERLKYPSTTTGRMPVPPDRAAGESGGNVQITATKVEGSSESPVPQPALPPGTDCC